MPMTILETETCHAIKGIRNELAELNERLKTFNSINNMSGEEIGSALRSIDDQLSYLNQVKEIDWEQRRYEIAKEIMPKLFDKYDRFETMAEKAVDMADYLIQKLKEKK